MKTSLDSYVMFAVIFPPFSRGSYFEGITVNPSTMSVLTDIIFLYVYMIPT